jgi:hypothetical protein
MNTQNTQNENPRAAASAKMGILWFDPGCAKLNPDDPNTLWTCSLRGQNGAVVAWAEGIDPEQTHDRCEAICRAVNAHEDLLEALATVRALAGLATVRALVGDITQDDLRKKIREICRAALAKAKGGTP